VRQSEAGAQRFEIAGFEETEKDGFAISFVKLEHGLFDQGTQLSWVESGKRIMILIHCGSGFFPDVASLFGAGNFGGGEARGIRG